MNLKNVIKRSGLTVDYDRSKIYNAIAGAAKEIPDSMTDEEKESITSQVENTIANLSSITVEEIQDVVEQVLMKQVSEEVCEAVQMILEKGPDAAMNVYNGRKVEKA